MRVTLPLPSANGHAAPAPRQPATMTEPPAKPVTPLLVSHDRAAELVGISPASWHRLIARGEVGPVPIKLGGRVLWQVASLEAWVAAGCPDRAEWQARLAARNGRRD
jgi:prophage regulatory protein